MREPHRAEPPYLCYNPIMDIATVAFGFVCLAFGCFTAYLRQRAPEKLGKLRAMQAFWGPRAGWVVHFIGYSLMPALCGAGLIYAGSRGHSLLEILR